MIYKNWNEMKKPGLDPLLVLLPYKQKTREAYKPNRPINRFKKRVKGIFLTIFLILLLLAFVTFWSFCCFYVSFIYFFLNFIFVFIWWRIIRNNRDLICLSIARYKWMTRRFLFCFSRSMWLDPHIFNLNSLDFCVFLVSDE